jgi:hypothetical protein
MKNLFYTFCVFLAIIALSYNNPVFAETQTKKVCVQQKDSKTNKTKVVCKQVKQHKKLEGTKVPDKKAK